MKKSGKKNKKGYQKKTAGKRTGNVSGQTRKASRVSGGKSEKLSKRPQRNLEKLSKRPQSNSVAEDQDGKEIDELLGIENDRTRNILLIIGGVIVLIALLGLLYTLMEYGKSDRIYSRAQKEFVVILPEEDVSVAENGKLTQGEAQGENQAGADSGKNPQGNTSQNPNGKDASGPEYESAGQQTREWYELASVDLERLQAAYPDVVGWIFFENEQISYPIVYSGDNETYLRTTYTGRSATAGSIFLDGESTPDFSDPHTLIYGHNMKNLSMFGRLRYYKTEKGYYENHRYFQIFTGGSIYRYEIFAYEDISAYSSIYDVYGADAVDISGLLRELRKNSYQDTGVEVGASDHIVTLSTCTGDGDTRMIVSAVRVDEHAR